MSKTLIQVDNVGKKYNILHREKSENDILISAFAGGLMKLFSRNKRPVEKEEFWALRDISFAIREGERTAVIGRNGAGKSTLLKILSRIVRPTTGRIEYSGKLASLLEVGTGFHGDLTGRENIYLNGSILGMTKREIDTRFDQIVAFSEIERFLDTPVKRYSSGMYVRLAFAVAAHLDPDILIVDEVLAVGDAEFQKKCLGRMKEVSSAGRTIIFVSHNMAAIQNLCDKCIYLKNGAMVAHGNTDEVVETYLRSSGRNDAAISERSDRQGSGDLRFRSFRLKSSSGKEIPAAQCGSDIEMEMEIEACKDLSNVTVSLGIDNGQGQRIAHFSNEVTNQVIARLSKGDHKISVSIPKLPFNAGLYSFTLFSRANGEITDWVQEAGTFTVEAGDFFHSGKLPPEGQSNVFIQHEFRHDQGV